MAADQTRSFQKSASGSAPRRSADPIRLLGRKLDRGGGPLLAWLCRVGAGWGRSCGGRGRRTCEEGKRGGHDGVENGAHF
jgi:hypothetical protein